VSALVVFPDGRWLRVAGTHVARRGSDVLAALPALEDETVVGIVAARDAIVTTIDLPDLTDVQAAAAARVTLAETSIAPLDTLQVAVGRVDDLGRRVAVSVDATHLTQRLVELAAIGLDPDHLIAAPLLLPQPETGFVRADLGGEVVMRGKDCAFADDAVLSPLLTRGQEVAVLDQAELETAIVDAIRHPEADLRHGIFMKRRRWTIDHERLRRLALATLAFGLVVLAFNIVHIVRLDTTASRLEAETRVQAGSLLPAGTVVTDPVLQVEARLASLGGSKAGFVPLAAAIAAAVNDTPNADLGSMTYESDGSLRATVRAASPADLSAVEARLTAGGLNVQASPVVANQGRPYRDITVRLR
jgi:general secretion pathway protein L